MKHNRAKERLIGLRFWRNRTSFQAYHPPGRHGLEKIDVRTGQPSYPAYWIGTPALVDVPNSGRLHGVPERDHPNEVMLYGRSVKVSPDANYAI